MAGSTGSSISSELLPAREGELQGHPDQSETYSIRFINHAPEPLQTPSFIENGEIDRRMHPSSGFALKKASRKESGFLSRTERNNDILLQSAGFNWH